MDTKKLKSYSANTTNTQIKVSGWKKHYDSDGITCYYNEDIVHLSISRKASSITGTMTQVFYNILSTELQPHMAFSILDLDGFLYVGVKDNSTGIWARTVGGSTASNKMVYAALTWKRK